MMSDLTKTSSDPGEREPSLRTQLLRAAADGELKEPQTLRAHLAAHPGDEQVVRAEQLLRHAIAERAATTPPRHLRAAIISRSHRGRRFRLRVLAVAASAALLAGGGYLVLRPPPFPGPGQLVNDGHRESLVSFIRGQHKECDIHAAAVARDFRITLDQAPAEFERILGAPPSLGRLSESGLRFLGAKRCAVPGRGRSIHMVFETQAAEPQRISVFIQNDTGELAIEPDRTYRLTSRKQRPAPDICVWKRDGFIYFVVSEDPAAEATALAAMDAAAPLGSL
jgi:hypothetical protein